MRKFVLFLYCLALTFGQAAFAAGPSGSVGKEGSDDVPPIILSGMEAYKNKGPEDAVRAWIKGSAVDGSKEALSQANNLRQIQDFYGAYRGFEAISSRSISPKTRIYYLALDFEKGPVFAKFVVYQAEQGWILVNFNFNTKEDLIPSNP